MPASAACRALMAAVKQSSVYLEIKHKMSEAPHRKQTLD